MCEMINCWIISTLDIAEETNSEVKYNRKHMK